LDAAALESEGRRDAARRQENVDFLIRNYRVLGHLIAKVDPLGSRRPRPPELDPAFYGFTPADLDRPFSTSNMEGSDAQTLRGILARLEEAYCGYISVQYMHIDDLVVREWIQRRIEDSEHRPKLSRQQQLRILTRLTDAVIFEEFVRRKYVGAKTFSLEGAESLVPLLDLAIEKAGTQEICEIVLGMAHRGRLNVLANIIGKSPQEIFREFEDRDAELFRGSGDVKYHLGYQSDFVTSTGRKIHLSLCFNPSHLEFVNPVAVGLVRAKQDRGADFAHEHGMALLIHGDAAFAAEGIVQETLNLSQLPGYTTGGTLHVIVNNQIGFTTPPEEGRSTVYASDVAKMLQIPIFHVNGEHPEAVAQVIELAMEFRKTFRRDVVVDMYCYRRLGHNEGDEPAFTQPILYETIERRMSVRDAYLEHLLLLGEVTASEAEEIDKRRQEHLERALSAARRDDFIRRPRMLGEEWRNYRGGPERPEDDVPTGVPGDQLAALLERLAEVPRDFHPHRKLTRMMEGRRAMARGERPLDWSTAEALALASLAAQGYRIRLSGQDSQRGTFSQRHAVLHDTRDGHTHIPARRVAEDQAPVDIYNSPLSEGGVLGFEYGYSLGYPDALVLWEAQFGDFANAAQVIIDQFITSAEEKWQQLSGLVLLLPHGVEGQGPEHTSARLERFLQLAAEQNVQVVIPSTPAQYFHCLRRQALRRWKKPLVVLTPKSLLRHARNVSPLQDCASGKFQRVIRDCRGTPANKTRRIILSSGKVYYELLQACEDQRRTDVALIRIEQLYPFPMDPLSEALAAYGDGTPAYWVQEEPSNMGALGYLRQVLGDSLLKRFPLSMVSRRAAASPASGSASAYQLEEKELLARALGEPGSKQKSQPETEEPATDGRQKSRLPSTPPPLHF
jgi:2-oxoglutarate dehydrogenase E1 component